MFRTTILCLVLTFAFMLTISCSGGGGNVVAPDPGGEPDTIGAPEKGERDVVAEEPGNTVCLGLWQFIADKATGEADLVQLRSADKILNVLGFMEPPPLTCMDLDWQNLNIDPVNGTVDVGVILTHPIPGDDIFTGFDVRGVCFGPVVTNADGLTIIPSPEFFKGVPFGYQDGLLGVPDSHANYEGLAGYKYYCDNLTANEDLAEFFSDTDDLAKRGCFSAGMKLRRSYHLDWNDVDHNFLVFNYAIYANYDWPIGAMPWDVDDWDINTANSAEAFCCSVTELTNNLYFGGGSGGGDISLQVEAWDWQGDIADVTIESLEPGVIAKASYDTMSSGGTAKSYVYEFNAVSGTPTSTADLDILITVTDSKNFGECWFLDLLPTSNAKHDEAVYNCWIHTATVVPGFGWARTWGGTGTDTIGRTAVDASGNIYVAGGFSGTVDFDPGPDTDNHSSDIYMDAFLSKFDSNGDFQWARTWGGDCYAGGRSVAVDNSGNVYVSGLYGAGWTGGVPVDFDPGPGVDPHQSNGHSDLFLSKFDSYGDFQWARTWGGTAVEYCGEVAADGTDGIYVAGGFQGIVDFDPGSETDYQYGAGRAFSLSKFNSNGDYQWARTWAGGSISNYPVGIAADDSGNAYVVGHFRGNVDFDPGSGTDYHASVGLNDACLSKFNSAGVFQWARTWGGSAGDASTGVTVDDSGNVYASGGFADTVDFDPGPGTDEHTSNGAGDAFFSKFNSAGDFQWVRTWGGIEGGDSCRGIALDGSGNIYVAGSFRGNVDFDPGPGNDDHTSNGENDAYLGKFISIGDFQWARTWGGSGEDASWGVAMSTSGNAFVSGYFEQTVDFNPGTGTDNHTSNGDYDVFLVKFLPDGYW